MKNCVWEMSVHCFQFSFPVCKNKKKFGIWGLAIFHVLVITVSCIGSIMHLLHKKEDYVTKIDGDWLNGKCQIIDTQSKGL